MKQRKKFLILLFLGGLVSTVFAENKKANYHIIPLPQEIISGNGNSFVLNKSVRIVCPVHNLKMEKIKKIKPLLAILLNTYKSV